MFVGSRPPTAEPAARDELAAFALGAEPEAFEGQQDRDRERVVELSDVDVAEALSRPGRTLAGPSLRAAVTVRSGICEMLV